MTHRFVYTPTPEEMPKTADVIVIGGGPAGAGVVWALERAQPGIQTVLIEAGDQLAAGSSLASLENFRTCWSARCLAAQMTRSVEIMLHADEYFGEGSAQALSVRQRGYLFCALNESQADFYRREVQYLHTIGLNHIEYLETDEVQKRFGWLGKALIGAKFDPSAGWIDSNALVYQMVKSAPSATVLLGVKNVRLLLKGETVEGVSTSVGTISAPKVVIAAGANAILIAKNAGLKLPLVIRPRQSFTSAWRHETYPEDGPMVIGSAPYPHIRPEANQGAIMGWEYSWNTKNALPGDPVRDHLLEPIEPIEALRDPRFPSLGMLLFMRQFKHTPGEGFGDPRYLRGRHNIGYYVYRDATAAYSTAPDGSNRPYDSERAILDAYPGVKGLYLSIAHSGHGIMAAPSAGEVVAAKVLNRPLPDPIFADFGIDVPWVEHDENAL